MATATETRCPVASIRHEELMAREFATCPYPKFAELQKDAPVHQVGDLPWYLVTRYDECLNVLFDPDTFSSEHDDFGPALAKIGVMPSPSTVERMKEIGGNRPGMSPVIPHKDPPAHGRQRRIVIKAVTSKFLKWEEFIETQTAALLDALEGGSETDLIDAIAAPLPIAVIADILGMPQEYVPRVKQWSDDMSRTAGRFPSEEDWMRMARSISEQRAMFSSEVHKRLAHPQPDLIGRIAAMTREERDAETGDEPLDADEGVELLTLVMLGGNETTTQLMGGALYYLATQPGLLDRIRADEKLIAGVIEESLRLTTPVFTMMRFARKDGEIGGCPIPKGSVVSVCWNQANRDPGVFENPDRFDPERTNARRHLAFGQGIHVCPGAQLARLETRIMLKRFAERVKSVELAGPGAVEYGLASLSVRGMTGLKVRYELFERNEAGQSGEAA